MSEEKLFVLDDIASILRDVNWHLVGDWGRGDCSRDERLEILIVLPDSGGFLFNPHRLEKLCTVHMCYANQLGPMLIKLIGPTEYSDAVREAAKRAGYRLTDTAFIGPSGEELPAYSEMEIFRELNLTYLPYSQRSIFAGEAVVVERKVVGSSGNEYSVRTERGVTTCTCPGFSYRNQCKHATKARGDT